MKLISASATNIGMTRAVNQDACFCKKIEDKKKNVFALCVICDGIGGLQSGEVASGMVINSVSEWWDRICEWIDIKSADFDVIFSHLKDGACDWNEELYDYINSSGINMGTTMSVIMILRDRYGMIQVGDSRIYQFRNNILNQLSNDDVAIRMNNGNMKSFLDNYMGKRDELYFTYNSGEILTGDIYMTCCDGFYHRLQTEDLVAEIKKVKKDEQLACACENLIRTMMSRGERDNITVAMMYFIK